MIDDTIAAVATALGEAGLAVVRVSGKDALTVVDRAFRPGGTKGGRVSESQGHRILYGHIVVEGVVIDEVLISVFKAPRSFTAEDVAEISCHGGMLVTRKVLDAVLGAGARLAEPGEFTRRAFVNGRIDLTQAEAVSDLIHARSELAMRASSEQLAGKLAVRINRMRDDLISVLAHVEAHIDFPDEDIAPDTRESLIGRMRQGRETMRSLLEWAEEGRILREGVRAAIVGRPNAGKSSLLNHLLGYDRAIVSEVAGTTRDSIHETASIRGIPVVFVDTAGLRATEDAIEKEGIERSRQALTDAELVLHVVDGHEPCSAMDLAYFEEFQGKKRIVVVNKADLDQRFELPAEFDFPLVAVSCSNSTGLDALKDCLEQIVWSGSVPSDSYEMMINSRHRNALERADAALATCLAGFEDDLSIELPAMDLRIATTAIGEIVGKTSNDDLLDSIFHQFCLGK